MTTEHRQNSVKQTVTSTQVKFSIYSNKILSLYLLQENNFQR